MDVIADIERKSREIIEAAEDLRSRQKDDLIAETENRKNAMQLLIEKEKTRIEQESLKEQTRELEELKELYVRQRAGLEEKFRQNKERWIEGIVRGCIGG